jgi:ABC-type glycerol-3-phosphate transport system substrate-binding protein
VRASVVMLMAAVVAALAACGGPADTAAPSPASAQLDGDWVLTEGIDVVDGYPVTL